MANSFKNYLINNRQEELIHFLDKNTDFIKQYEYSGSFYAWASDCGDDEPYFENPIEERQFYDEKVIGLLNILKRFGYDISKYDPIYDLVVDDIDMTILRGPSKWHITTKILTYLLEEGCSPNKLNGRLTILDKALEHERNLRATIKVLIAHGAKTYEELILEHNEQIP